YDNRLDSHPEYVYPPHGETRRRPRPFESSVETVRRLIDLNGLRQALSGMQTAAILGGSVSYGRFYNVTGAATEFGSNPSDTDVLLVLNNYEDLGAVGVQLATVKGVDKDSVNKLADRVRQFEQVRQRYQHCIFSHKLRLWK